MSTMPSSDDPDHPNPYVEEENTQQWRSVNKAIGDLVQNKDLIERTPREYIVGYICSRIKARGAKPSCD